jgi:Raf kinase inhibitor-like YbhB/YbcL family protein
MVRTRQLSPVFLLLSFLATSCGTRDGANEAKGGSTVDNATLTSLELTSTAFQDGQSIPPQFTCDGPGRSPPLTWGEPPAGTKSFALIVDDPDAPSGLFRHWGAYDIPASARSMSAGQPVGAQAVNGFGKAGYGGPCPPKGHGAHHYHFKLFALEVDKLDVGANARVADVENAARKHAIAQAELVGTYERR